MSVIMRNLGMFFKRIELKKFASVAMAFSFALVPLQNSQAMEEETKEEVSSSVPANLGEDLQEKEEGRDGAPLNANGEEPEDEEENIASMNEKIFKEIIFAHRTKAHLKEEMKEAVSLSHSLDQELSYHSTMRWFSVLVLPVVTMVVWDSIKNKDKTNMPSWIKSFAEQSIGMGMLSMGAAAGSYCLVDTILYRLFGGTLERVKHKNAEDIWKFKQKIDDIDDKLKIVKEVYGIDEEVLTKISQNLNKK
jgi:hypothetical protein